MDGLSRLQVWMVRFRTDSRPIRPVYHLHLLISLSLSYETPFESAILTWAWLSFFNIYYIIPFSLCLDSKKKESMLVLGTTHTHTYICTYAHTSSPEQISHGQHDTKTVCRLYTMGRYWAIEFWTVRLSAEAPGECPLQLLPCWFNSASPPAIAWDIDHWSHCSDTLSSPTLILFKVVDFLPFVVYVTRISLPVHPCDRFLCCYVLCQAVSDSESGHNFHSSSLSHDIM